MDNNKVISFAKLSKITGTSDQNYLPNAKTEDSSDKKYVFGQTNKLGFGYQKKVPVCNDNSKSTTNNDDQKKESTDDPTDQDWYDPRIKFIVNELGLIQIDKPIEVPNDKIYKENEDDYNDLVKNINKLDKLYKNLVLISIEQKDLFKVIESFCSNENNVNKTNIAEKLISKYNDNINKLDKINKKLDDLKKEQKQILEKMGVQLFSGFNSCQSNYYGHYKIINLLEEKYFWNYFLRYNNNNKNNYIPVSSKRKEYEKEVLRYINIFRMVNRYLSRSLFYDEPKKIKNFILYRIKNKDFDPIVDKIINQNKSHLYEKEYIYNDPQSFYLYNQFLV